MTKQSAMSRTLQQLREEGWTCEKTERWQSFFGRKDKATGMPIKGGGVRVDMFGFVDVLAFQGTRYVEGRSDTSVVQFHPPTILAIQVTSSQNHGDVGKHLRKLRETPAAVEWVRCGFPLELWDWAKRNDRKRGARKVWGVKVIRVTSEMLQAQEAVAV